MGVLSMFSSCFTCGKENNNDKKTKIASEEPIASSKDGTNFKFTDDMRFQNEAEVAYILPNNYDELDRLQQQHWMFKYILQTNFHAPVEDTLQEGIKVLDAGCGPGTWTLEMAESYRKSTFYGVDSSAVFPEDIKPCNVEFLVGNLSKTLPFQDNYFDYCFQRLLVLGLTNEGWDNVISEHYRMLKPGGYIELFECDMYSHYNMGPLTTELHEKLLDVAKKANVALDIAEQLNGRLSKAGFTNIAEKKCDLKLNHTDKGGELLWEDFKYAFFHMRSVLAKLKPEWEDLEIFEKYIDACAQECKENKTTGYTVNIYVAQKPE